LPAAPLATSLGIGRAAQQGILIRRAAFLERLAHLRVVAFDKTGASTMGRASRRPVSQDAALR